MKSKYSLMIMSLSMMYACNTQVNSFPDQNTLTNKDSIFCSELIDATRHRIDSIDQIPFAQGDLSSFEASPYGKKLMEIKQLVNDKQCPNLSNYFFSDIVQIEGRYKAGYDDAVYAEKHKNDPRCDEPKITSSEIQKNEDFHPFLVATIKNNCNQELRSLKIKVDYSDYKSSTISIDDRLCTKYLIVKVQISSYAEDKISVPLEDASTCYNSENPKVEIIEYCYSNGTAQATVESAMEQMREKVKKKEMNN